MAEPLLGDTDLGDVFGNLFGRTPTPPPGELARLREAYGELRARCLTAEGKLARIDALCADPGESHRLLTRKEVLAIVRG